MKFKVSILAGLFGFYLTGCENNSESNGHPLPEPTSEGAIVYKKFCSDCHAPPRIVSHKADEWLNVIERMQRHRIKQAYHPLNDVQKDTLLSYLKKHSIK